MASTWPNNMYPVTFLGRLPQDNQYGRWQATPSLQISSLEETLAAARPHLLRLAQRKGVAPDALDDIVQESLLDAWRQLHTLRQPERFSAWLDGICRNRCCAGLSLRNNNNATPASQRVHRRRMRRIILIFPIPQPGIP